MKKGLAFAVVTALSATALFAGDAKTGLNRDYWTGLKGGPATVEANMKGNVAPTGSDLLESFEAVSWDGTKKTANFAEQYGQTVYGFVVPEKSGDYIFWIAADDVGTLNLSSDENPANLKPIAKTSVWTGPRQFTKASSQKSAPVKLEAGKKYYIQAIMVEGGGGDNLAVAWTKPGDPQDKPSEVIPGKNLQPAKAVVPAKAAAPATPAPAAKATAPGVKAPAPAAAPAKK